jgi:ABC-type uncharacterized transport system substrate-binding protein|tara:strand:- start:1328 stop:1480 length:153 start_codon:yes stop_codon:yes gene_type:complete
MGTKIEWIEIDEEQKKELDKKLLEANTEQEKELLHKEYYSKIFKKYNGGI